MTALIVVPARGGSRRLPAKNLAPIAGMPLIAHAILAARRFVIDAAIDARIVIDTDSPDIAAEAVRWGAESPGLRPAHLAADDTTSADSTLGLLERAGGPEPRALILLQPTAPLRTADDIAACWRRFVDTGQPVVTVREDPVHAGALVDPDGAPVAALAAVPLRQLNGAVYITTPALLRAHRSFIIPRATQWVDMPAHRSVDIDTEADLLQARALVSARQPAAFSVGERSIGAGRCYLIAEAGVNHNGSIALARELVDIAADAGADAVKFQTFDPDALAAPAAPTAAYQRRNTGDSSQHELLRALTLPAEAFVELAERAHARGITFLSTAFDRQSADLLSEMGVPALKVPSGELTNLPFIEYLAAHGRPMLVSTGMSDMAEVADAMLAIHRTGNTRVALFHCVSDYPARAADCNLTAMAAMRDAFAVPVGWSDHTDGIDISIAAVAAGAQILEKHFTVDRSLPGPDHGASLDPAGLRSLVAAVRSVEAAMKTGPKAPTCAERETAAVVRRSLHVARDLPPGHVLAADDIVALRPGTGLRPAEIHRVAGRALSTPLRQYEMLREEDLEPRT